MTEFPQLDPKQASEVREALKRCKLYPTQDGAGFLITADEKAIDKLIKGWPLEGGGLASCAIQWRFSYAPGGPLFHDLRMPLVISQVARQMLKEREAVAA